jgi:hypothetical protein
MATRVEPRAGDVPKDIGRMPAGAGLRVVRQSVAQRRTAALAWNWPHAVAHARRRRGGAKASAGGDVVPTAREDAIVTRIAAAHLLVPTAVAFSSHGGGIAVAFTIKGVTETFEGCGASDYAAADDVVRQLRERLAHLTS